jgi:beta,beta-carotene 9',10'-dioxygenase
MASWRDAFLKSGKAVDYSDLMVKGALPDWLDGAFISTGPGLFDFSGKKSKHWFDGLALLKAFYFKDSAVSFKSTFLRSDEYLREVDGSLKEKTPYDNGNVAVLQSQGQGVALTESLRNNTFAITDLEATGHFDYADDLELHMCLAHALKDPLSGDWVNVGVTFGPKTTYTVFSIDENTRTRQILATYQSDLAFYMHSFALTKNYIVLFQSPLILDFMALMGGDVGFDEVLKYQSDKPSAMIVIDRATTKARCYPTKPFVCFHQVNAYDEANRLVIDLCCSYGEASYNDLSMDVLARGRVEADNFLERIDIDLSKNTLTQQRLSDTAMEFPRVAQSYQGVPYRYAYLSASNVAPGAMYGGLVKMDVDTKVAILWEEDHCHAGEAIFVPKPDGVSEDDGIALSMVYNSQDDYSFLLVLNGRDFKEIARVNLPVRMPFSLHGDWFLM